MDDKTLVILSLSLGLSNDEIKDFLPAMKLARERKVTSIVCLIAGFGDDPREIYQIPEARAFCRRLVDTGFISYLDTTTTIEWAKKSGNGEALGALEVWLIAENRFAPEIPNTIFEEFNEVVLAANAKCDALLGPML